MYVIGLRLDDGKVSPLAWTKRELSTKELRRATRKFKKDADVVEPYQADWFRLYDTKSEAKKDLPEYA